MDLLVCLARHHGRTVPREQLLDEVWRNQCVVDTAIARCIAELRQALGDNAQSPAIIETIPKRGYRIIAPVEFSTPPAADDVLVPMESAASAQTASQTASHVLTMLAAALADSFSIWTRRS
jgi:DNA-binding winged helix-turn-helix (wHTH) protein